jgi:ankyrin repeat protein
MEEEGLFFHHLLDDGDLSALKQALITRPFIDTPRGSGKWTLLHRIILHGHSSCCNELVNLLLDAKADVNARTDNLATPLDFAMNRKFFDCAKLLLHRGADPNTSNDDDYSVIFTAIYNRNLDMVRLLIDCGASLSKKSGTTTPLEYALFSRSKDCAEIIYDACPTRPTNYCDRRHMELFHSIQEKRHRFRRSARTVLGVLRRRFRVAGATGPEGCIPLDLVRLLGQHMRATRFEQEWE